MGKRLRILFLTTDSQVAGTERVCLNLLTNLDSERFEFYLLTLKPEGDLQERLRTLNIQTGALDIVGGVSILRGSLRLAKCIRQFQPDLLVTFLFHGNVLGRMVGTMVRVPAILSCQEGLDEWRRPWHNALDRGTSLVSRSVIANSQAVKRRYVEHTGIRADKVIVIPNGLDLAHFEKRHALDGETRDQVRAELDVADDLPVIGHVANLLKEKDHDNLLRSFAILRDKRIPFQALLAGSGKLESVIRGQIDALDLGGCVRLLGYRTDIERLYNAFDVATLSSYEEGMPISILEAMAARCSVVATSVGGIPEVIVHGQTGLLVPSRTPAALANAFEHLLSDKDERDRMGTAGYQRLVERFTFTRQVEAHARLYEETIVS